METVKRYVVRGLGIAVVSGICVTPEDRAAVEAIEVPEEFHGATTYGVVLRRDKHRSRALAGLLGLLGTEGIAARSPRRR